VKVWKYIYLAHGNQNQAVITIITSKQTLNKYIVIRGENPAMQYKTSKYI
jgi:hypothetical protein